jgi:hypothetical protein
MPERFRSRLHAQTQQEGRFETAGRRTALGMHTLFSARAGHCPSCWTPGGPRPTATPPSATTWPTRSAARNPAGQAKCRTPRPNRSKSSTRCPVIRAPGHHPSGQGANRPVPRGVSRHSLPRAPVPATTARCGCDRDRGRQTRQPRHPARLWPHLCQLARAPDAASHLREALHLWRNSAVTRTCLRSTRHIRPSRRRTFPRYFTSRFHVA